MNHFTRCRSDCQVGAKALQNISASLHAFEILSGEFVGRNHFLLTATFCFGAVSYAKPFVNAKNSDGGVVRYPIAPLKRAEGFLPEMHAHLLEIRNTLVAHDDFTYIEPRIIMANLNDPRSGAKIPISITVTNKCISYPSEFDDVKKMKGHVAATLTAIRDKLEDDLGRLRRMAIAYPDEAEEARKYARNHDRFDVPADGYRLNVPEFSAEPWLNVPEPDFSSVHKGFRYQRMDVRHEFLGPETIDLPNGERVVIKPNAPKG